MHRTHPETLLGLQPRKGGLRRRQARSPYRSFVKYAVARLPGLGAPSEASLTEHGFGMSSNIPPRGGLLKVEGLGRWALVAWVALLLATGGARGAGQEPHGSSYQRGVKAFQTGNFQEAVELLQQVVGEEPDNPEATLTLGLAYYRLRQYPEAIVALEQAVVLTPSSQTAHFHLGLLYEQQHQVDEAMVHWQRFLDTNPGERQAEMARRHLARLEHLK